MPADAAALDAGASMEDKRAYIADLYFNVEMDKQAVYYW